MAKFFKKRNGVRRRPVRARARGTKKSGVRGVSAAVKKYVNRTVHAQIEDKDNSWGVTDNIGNIYASPSMNCFPAFNHPQAQGSQTGERVGNQIRVKTLIHKYVLFPTPYDLTQNPTPKPQEVILWWGRLKRSATEIPSATDFQRFFQFGANAISPTGDIRDVISYVNTDMFTIFATRRHKLGNSNYQYDPSNVSKPYQFSANNDFKLNHVNTINLTKYMKKVQKYDDDYAPIIGQSNVFVWATTVNADGTLQTGVNIRPVQWYSYFNIKYEDA